MIKLINDLCLQQKSFLKPFAQKLKQLRIKSRRWLSQKRGQVKNSVKKLPFNYHEIPKNLGDRIAPIAFFIVFIISLVLPTDQALKTKKAFLSQPNNFNNQMKMVEALIANGHFEMAKKELDKIGNPNFLPEDEKLIWQEKYLLWAQNSPEGQKELISRWQEFTNEHPYDKIGWLYLGCYQQLAKNNAAAQESFQKAKSIDPGLEEEIEKITNSQLTQIPK